MRRLFLIKKYGKKDRNTLYGKKKNQKNNYKGNIGIPEFDYKRTENITRSKQLIVKPKKNIDYLKLLKGSRR